jgi:hypothetical protein
MERKKISAVALVMGSLLLGACEQTGRYQLVVAPPFEGETRYGGPQEYVIDTKKGVVWKLEDVRQMITWDPVNKTLRLDSLELPQRKK